MTDTEVNGRALLRKSSVKGVAKTEFYSLPVKFPGLRPPPTGLPDGGTSFNMAGPDSDIAIAHYEAPTDRYPHGALGDDIEAGRLVLGNDQAPKMSFDLPENLVFEDRTPRLIDFDGFGQTYAVTILSSATEGAALAIYGLDDRTVVEVTRTQYIGTPNRWLNIAGIEDFDGSGSSSVALIQTPHIGGILQFWRWSTAEGKPTLTKIAEAPGFSNHEFGSREQRLSAVEDFDNDGVSDIAVPSADRRTLKIVKLSGFKDTKIQEIASIPLPSPIDKAIGVTRKNDDVVLTVGLEDGSVYAIHQ